MYYYTRPTRSVFLLLPLSPSVLNPPVAIDRWRIRKPTTETEHIPQCHHFDVSVRPIPTFILSSPTRTFCNHFFCSFEVDSFRGPTQGLPPCFPVPSRAPVRFAAQSLLLLKSHGYTHVVSSIYGVAPCKWAHWNTGGDADMTEDSMNFYYSLCFFLGSFFAYASFRFLCCPKRSDQRVKYRKVSGLGSVVAVGWCVMQTALRRLHSNVSWN